MKSLMFKEDLFNAIIQGKKTETRRLLTSKRFFTNEIFNISSKFAEWYIDEAIIAPDYIRHYVSPRIFPVETVYLKEPYFVDPNSGQVSYKYDYDQETLDFYYKGVKWKNKMFMPEKYARYFLEIESVELEFLKNISVDSISCEGVSPPSIENWQMLWDSINKNNLFESNPVVWCYKFSLLK